MTDLSPLGLAALSVPPALAGAALAARIEPLPRWAPAPVALAVAGAVWLGAAGPVGLSLALWSLPLIILATAAAAVDAAAHRLPDGLSLALIVTGLGFQWASGGAALPLLGVAVLLVLIGIGLDRFDPEGPVGAGDLILAAGILCWLGFAPVLEFVIVAALLLWLHFLGRAGLRLARHGRQTQLFGGLPFAPAALLALIVIWAAGLPPA